jgi:hypothetical protein
MEHGNHLIDVDLGGITPMFVLQQHLHLVEADLVLVVHQEVVVEGVSKVRSNHCLLIVPVMMVCVMKAWEMQIGWESYTAGSGRRRDTGYGMAGAWRHWHVWGQKWFGEARQGKGNCGVATGLI